jgi:hypothetical protein
MLKRRRHLPLLASCILLLALLAWAKFFLLREPSYGDRSLTSWLKDVGGFPPMLFSGGAALSASREDLAIDAVRHMGAQAYPFLFEMLKAEDGPMKNRILKKLGKQRYEKLGLVSANDKRARAKGALTLLGPDAAIAWKQILLDPTFAKEMRLLAITKCQTPPEDAATHG